MEQVGLSKTVRGLLIELASLKRLYDNANLEDDMKHVVYYRGRIEELRFKYRELTGQEAVEIIAWPRYNKNFNKDNRTT